MQKKILASLVMTIVVLTGCSSPQVSNAKAQSVAYVKPVVKTSLLDKIKARQVKQTKKQIVKVALSGNGVSYVFRGNTPYGWDCSGFTSYVYSKFGVSLEHSANKQGHMKHTKKPAPGDVVAFSFDHGKTYYHVGIYLGNNTIINANSSYGKTMVESLDDFKGQTIVYIKVL